MLVLEDQLKEIAEAADRFELGAPQEALRWVVERYRHVEGGVVLACSFGMQSVVCIDMLAQMNLLDDVEVFYIDTGVLFPETHQTRLKIQERYGFRAVKVGAELTWEDQQQKFSGNLCERGKEGIDQCCHIRKVEPQRRYLQQKHAAAWITGMRRHHNRTRADMPIVLWDSVNSMVKVNPVALLDDKTLWGYIKAFNVPYNPLYDQGYGSIGCNTPQCTRPTKPGEDPRAGRWAGTGKTECGIHLDGNQIKSLDASGL